jgi:hypothetical protein
LARRKDNELAVLLAVDRTAKISGRGAFQLNKERNIQVFESVVEI